MNIRDGIKQLNNFNLIILDGDDQFYKDAIVEKIKSSNPIPAYKLDCSETKDYEVINLIEARDLLSEKKLIILSQFEAFKNFKQFPNDSENKIIILSEKLNKATQNKLKNALYIECFKPKQWEQKSIIINRIKKFLNDKKYEITEGAADYLYEQIGYDLYKLSNELNKILLYKTSPCEIFLSDLKKICPPGTYFNVYDIMDFILDNKKKEALLILNKMYKEDKNSVILLISLWNAHLENLLYLLSAKKTREEISKAIKIPVFIIEKKLLKQTEKIDHHKILKAMNYLIDLDVKFRCENIDIKNYLERFILEF